MSDLRDDIAALAIGAAPADDAPELTGQLAADPQLRAAYRADLEAAGLAGFLAEASFERFSDARKDALKSTLMSALQTTRQRAARTPDYTRVVPRERLVPYSDGVLWAVLPSSNVTTIYWVFDPPACGDQPFEVHEQTQSGFVLEGELTLHFPEGSQPRKAGDLYTIEAGVPHSASFQSRTILCDVYSPRHEAFEARYKAHISRQNTQF